VSIVLAIAITALEVVVAFRHTSLDVAPERSVPTNVVLERAAPTPRPVPAATPTPPPPPVRATAAPVPERAAPRARHAAGGTSVARPPAPHPVHPAVAAGALPGNGAGSGTGPGAGDDTGAGAGTGGAGSGAIDADVPCGYVEFIPSEAPKIAGNVSSETVRATVHFPDGHTESEDFPYAWVYADWMNTDPWSPVNVTKRDLTIPAQLPPPGTDTHRYNEVIRYILDHTGPTGRTLLQPCPGSR
jgi:hypothetical protein